MPGLGPIRRALKVIAHVLIGIALAFAAGLSRRVGLGCRWVPTAARWWYRRLCTCLELRLEAVGEPRRGALLVANHTSWLDIPVVGAFGAVTFVAKSEIGRWPVVGGLAKAAGTLFIKRGANQAADVIEQIGRRIATGGSVLIFPEGTTSDGRSLRRFHPRLLAAAQSGGYEIQPVAIRYGSNANPDLVAPFVGNDTLAAHLLRVLRRPGIPVQIGFLTPIDRVGLDRRAVADAARGAIAARLDLTDATTETANVPRDTGTRRRPPTR